MLKLKNKKFKFICLMLAVVMLGIMAMPAMATENFESIENLKIVYPDAVAEIADIIDCCADSEITAFAATASNCGAQNWIVTGGAEFLGGTCAFGHAMAIVPHRCGNCGYSVYFAGCTVQSCSQNYYITTTKWRCMYFIG